MLEGYQPIDFSSVLPPVDMGQMRNRVGLSQAATSILSNSQWSSTPISTLLKSGLTSSGEAPKRKQTLWGRTVDLLSTPVYAVANAADDALAGHQSDDMDSVLSDAGQVIGGVITGAGRGIGTGFRGAFAGSESAADPTDKQYLGDFLIRYDTHMSAEDAMKPENIEKVRQRLMGKKINQFDDSPETKYFYDWDKKRVEVTDDDIQQYFQDMHVYGLGASMVADPLNFVKGPTGLFSKGESGIEVPGKVLSGSKNTYEGFKSAPKGAAINGGELKFQPTVGKAAGSYKVTLPAATVQNKVANPATGELISPPAWFDFPKSAAEVGGTPVITQVPKAADVNQLDPLDDILGNWASGSDTPAKIENALKSRQSMFPVAKVPDNQLRAARSLSRPEDVHKLTGDLLRRAATGDANWSSNLLGRLTIKYPGAPFDQTVKLIKHVSQVEDLPKRLGNAAERKKIIGAFNRTIMADVAAMKLPPKIKPAEVIINEAAKSNPINLERLVAGAKPNDIVGSKNPVRDAGIVDAVIKKYEPQLSLKTIPKGINDHAAYIRTMRKHGAYTGPKQANVWNSLTSKHLVNLKTPQRFEKALGLLRHIEDRFIEMGHIPMSATPRYGSVPLRLSQVIDAIGPAAAAMDRTLLTKILRGEPSAIANLPAEVVQKIEELKAGEALVDGSKMVQGVDTASKNIDDLIKGPLSAARMEEVVTIGSKVADDITRMAGGSGVAAKRAAEATRAGFLPKNPIDAAVKSKSLNTLAMISHPDVSVRLLRKYSSAPSVAKAINLSIGGPTPSQLGKIMSSVEAMVPEWLGARFNAAYKNSDMRPQYLREAATAKASVALRAQHLNNLAKKFPVNDADLWSDALKGAQGKLAPVAGSPADELSKELIKVMENLFSSSGLKAGVALENSVVGRSQLFMTELNKSLRRFGLGQYQFAKKGDYAEGAAWLNSWEAWEIKNPLDFLFKVQNVVEHTVREKIMFEEIAARFATTTKGGDFTHTVTSHPRLAGYYFGKEAAGQAEQFVKNLKEISKPNSKAMQNFDKVLSKWKAGVTIYVPSHHVRNMIGDVYFNWISGVNSLHPYGTAMRVMKSQKGRYEGLDEMSNLTSPGALKALMNGGPTTALGKQTALTMRNGTHVTNDMVYVSAFQQGILPTTRVLEDIPDDAMSALDKIRPLGGRGQKAAHTISEGRDHYVRLAHYVDALKKSGKPFEQAIEEAAATVRKWHPDGMDMTKFERNVMRRTFPFYSWTRKAIPLIIESMVATPGKTMVIPKGSYMLQNMLGIQTGPMSDPFPYDQLFPDWIREKGIGPIGGPESLLTGALGGDPGYSVINPGNPTMDTISQFNHPGKMAMGMLNPAAKIPIELATGADSQTGAPISGTDPDYIAKQLPGLSHAGRISGEFGVSDTTKETSSGFNMQNIINLMLALGAQNTGPYQKSAEFDLRDYLKSTR